MQAASSRCDYLDALNPAQREAATYGARRDGAPFSSGPLLVVAGAGTGKTMTLAHRVAHLVVAGVDTRRILLLTFTRRAAQEMTRRVEAILRRALADESVKAVVLRVDSGGGSAFASEIIRREIELTRQEGKPVVASMGSVAASGGYWIAIAMRKRSSGLM